MDGSLPLGGAERRFFRLFKYLRENGYDIQLCTSTDGAEACKALGIDLDMKWVYILPGGSGSTNRMIQYWVLIARTISLIRWLRRKHIHHVSLWF